jgi:signal transduction histidine kinase
MKPSAAAPASDKLARLSRTMEWVTTIGMILIVVLMIVGFFLPSWTRNVLLYKLGATGAELRLDPPNQFLAAAIMAVPVGVMVWGLWHVRALFRDFAQGRAFSSGASRHLQQFGVSVVIQGPLGPLTATALALALTLGNPPGQRLLVLALSVNDYFALIVGGVLVAVAVLMREATRLADENAGFV